MNKPLTVRGLINHLESLIKDNPELDVENMLVAREDYDDYAVGPSTWISPSDLDDVRLVNKLETLDEDGYEYDVGYSDALDAETYFIVIN